mgnify:FL=1
MVSIAYFFGFLISKSYVGVIRHTSVQDTFRLFFGASLGASITIVLTLLFRNQSSVDYSGLPHSITLIHYLLSMFLLLGTRFAGKALYITLKQELLGKDEKKKDSIKVMIYGAGDSGQVTRSSLESEAGRNVKMVGFIDDNPSLHGKRINGVQVYSKEQAFDHFFQNQKVDEVIISIQNISVGRKQRLVNECLNFNIRVKNVPPVETWINGELSAKQIRDVQIEELLGREVILLEKENIIKEITGSTIMVTGAAGSIGSEIVRQVFAFKPKVLIMVDQAESALYEVQQELSRLEDQGTTVIPFIADVRRKKRIRQAFKTYKPSMVYHAAAYKHVPLMEANPIEAIQVNIMGTRNLANLSVEFGVNKFVMISTDKAVNPTNVMGATKRAAEMYCRVMNQKQEHTRFITTRFGNVLGSNGSVIPLFKKQIAEGGPVLVTHPEITRFFMTISEACSLVLEAGAMGNGGEVFIFDMGESVKIIDLARKMIKLSGLEPGVDMEIQFSGLRPGEKLYEELLANKENTLPTHHKKIMIAKIGVPSISHVEDSLLEIETCTKDQDPVCLVRALKTMVPEFRSQNSEFEVLDKS